MDNEFMKNNVNENFENEVTTSKEDNTVVTDDNTTAENKENSVLTDFSDETVSYDDEDEETDDGINVLNNDEKASESVTVTDDEVAPTVTEENVSAEDTITQNDEEAVPEETPIPTDELLPPVESTPSEKGFVPITDEPTAVSNDVQNEDETALSLVKEQIVEEMSDILSVSDNDDKLSVDRRRNHFVSRSPLMFRDEEGNVKSPTRFTKMEAILNNSYQNLTPIRGIISRSMYFEGGTPYAEIYFTQDNINASGNVYIRVDEMGFNYTEKAKTMLAEKINDDMTYDEIKETQRNILNELNMQYLRIIDRFVGASVDFIVKGINDENIVFASRRDAMLLNRRINFFPLPNSASARVNEGSVTNARILVVHRREIIIDVHGYTLSLRKDAVTSYPCNDLRNKFNQNDMLKVVVSNLKGIEDCNVRSPKFGEQSDKVTFSAKTVACVEERKEIFKKSKTYFPNQRVTAEVISINPNGTLYLMFPDGVPAVCPNYRKNPMPQPRDRVVVQIREITRIAKYEKVIIYCQIKRITFRYSNNPNALYR